MACRFEVPNLIRNIKNDLFKIKLFALSKEENKRSEVIRETQCRWQSFKQYEYKFVMLWLPVNIVSIAIRNCSALRFD